MEGLGAVRNSRLEAIVAGKSIFHIRWPILRVAWLGVLHSFGVNERHHLQLEGVLQEGLMLDAVSNATMRIITKSKFGIGLYGHVDCWRTV